MKNPEDAQKWEFLKRAPFTDAQDFRIRRCAHALHTAAGGKERCFVQLAHALARDCITYVRDTQRGGDEDIAGYTREPTPNDAVEALKRGRDDCDAKARLFVALCLAQRLLARMVPLWRGGQLQHVAAEVRLDGQWVPVELTLARARLGDRPQDIPVEPNTKQWRRS